MLETLLSAYEKGTIKCVTFTLSDTSLQITFPGVNCEDTTTDYLKLSTAKDLISSLRLGNLHPLLLPCLDNSPANFFCEGCVLARIVVSRERDNREPEFAVLRPTLACQFSDLQNLLKESTHLTTEQKKELETPFFQVYYQNSKEACANQVPRPSACKAPGSERQMGNNARKRTLIDLATEHEFKISRVVKDLSSTFSNTVDISSNERAGTSGSNYQTFSDHSFPYLDPLQIVQKRPPPSPESALYRDAEFEVKAEYTIEVETGLPKSTGQITPAEDSPSPVLRTVTQIALLKRLIDLSFFGEVSIRSAILEWDPGSNGLKSRFVDERNITSRFPLGTEDDANMYVHQYLDMVTEGGKKRLKIAKIVPGQDMEFLLPHSGDIFDV